MTKSYGPYLLKVVSCILDDATNAFPDSQREFGRDFDRLTRCLEAQGPELFTIQLPALGKHFDKCLEKGHWEDSSLPLSRRKGPRSAIPRLFWGLHRLVFESSGMLRVRPDVTAILFLRQLFAVGKKFKDDCHESRTYKTVQDFYRLEDRLPSPSLLWDEDEIDLDDPDRCDFHNYRYRHSGREQLDLFGDELPRSLSVLLRKGQQVADLLACELGVFDPYLYTPKHGPGAVSDLPSGSYKYDFPSWSRRLSAVFPFSDFAFANLGAWADWVSLGYGNAFIDDDTPCSKLIKVPKTHKGPRLIASEPVAHQWCQQIILDYFNTRYQQTLMGSFVHFRDQSYNREAARKASRNGKSWTVDLSSASDCVSLRLVERVFRRNSSLLRALHASRTSHLKQDLDKKMPKYIKLKKFSTMGSACTFPVESHCFLVLVLTSILYSRNLPITRGNLLKLKGEAYVFGDDIVVPSDSGEALCTLLRYFHFGVNQAKTFKSGRFRESCGSENFDGECVTPSYVLREYENRRPESVDSLVASSNNFFMKGFWKTAEFLRSTISQVHVPVIGLDSGLPGFKTYCKGVGTEFVPPHRTRYNKSLHRDEILIDVISNNVKKISKPGYGPLLQFFTEDPGPDVVWASGAVDKRRPKIRRRWVALSALS